MQTAWQLQQGKEAVPMVSNIPPHRLPTKRRLPTKHIKVSWAVLAGLLHAAMQTPLCRLPTKCSKVTTVPAHPGNVNILFKDTVACERVPWYRIKKWCPLTPLLSVIAAYLSPLTQSILFILQQNMSKHSFILIRLPFYKGRL